MQSITILVGNEPRAYRDVLARLFAMLGPGVTVHLADPDQLDDGIARIDPDLVVCSQLTNAVAARTNWFMWPGTGPGGVLRRNGTETTVDSFDLASLLETVDAVDHEGDR